jgi:hypothetical protein
MKIIAQLTDKCLTSYLFGTTLGEKLSQESLWNHQAGKASAVVKAGSFLIGSIN